MSHSITPARFIRRAGALAAGLVLFGCASIPMSADAAFGGSPTPSPAMASATSAGAHDGLYAGTASIEVNGSNRCRSAMSITNFQVNGNMLSFGGFRSPIAADGNVQQTYFRGMWLAGRFDGAKFTGHIDATGDPTTLLNTCVYAINVTRQPA